MGSKRFRRIVQVGIVVKDIEKARALWAKLLGVEGTPIVEVESWESTRMMFRGKPSDGRAKLVFFNLENLDLELIEPIGGPSTWQNFAEKCGNGIHHIAVNVENLEETLENLKAGGIGVEQRGEFKGGCYTYVDSKIKLGATIELLHRYG